MLQWTSTRLTMISFLDIADEAMCTRWDDCCAQSSLPTLFHSSRWARAICQAYGVGCRSYFEADDDGKPVWLLPLFETRTISLKRRWASVAYAPYGGVMGCLDASQAVDPMTALQRIPAEVVPRRPVIWREPSETAADEADLSETDRVTMWLKLPAEADKLWSSLRAKERNQVRKAEKSRVSVKNGPEHIDAFYGLYAKRMHELGTPAHRRSFFAALAEHFGTDLECLVAYHEDVAVAGILDIEFVNWRVNLYGAADIAKRALCANNLVYWESLRRAIDHGKARFDFGRSLFGSGQYRFKRHWGAQPHHVRQCLFTPTGEGGWVMGNISEPGGRLPSLWRKMPGFAVSLLSPRVRPFVF